MKKNIFLLVLDGLRPDRMSCCGHKRKTTPFIDSLVEKSVSFSNAYSVAHSSLPAHISLFTGIHPYFHKAASNHSYFNNQFPYLTKILKENGYRTIGISTLNSYLSVECGFIRYFDKYIKVIKSNRVSNAKIKRLVNEQARNTYGDKKFIDILKDIYRKNLRYHNFHRMSNFYLKNDLGGKKIVEVIKNQFDMNSAKDKPFFMFANILETHTPFLPPKDFRDYFGKRRLTHTVLDSFFNPHLFQAGRISFTPEEQETLEILYDGGVRYVDSLAEDLFDYLDKKGYLDNTVVIILSDHGEMLNEHDHLIGHGDSTYEGMVRIPIMIFDKKEGKARIIKDSPVSLIDAFATIVNLAGGTLDKSKFNYKCENLLGDIKPERPIVCECTALPFLERLYKYPEIIVESSHVERTIVDKPFKFIWRSNGKHALYDLSRDKAEKSNIFEQYKGTKVKDLMNKLISWYMEQLDRKDFFSLEHFDYQILRGAGSFKPKELVLTQDEENIVIVEDKLFR